MVRFHPETYKVEIAVSAEVSKGVTVYWAELFMDRAAVSQDVLDTEARSTGPGALVVTAVHIHRSDGPPGLRGPYRAFLYPERFWNGLSKEDKSRLMDMCERADPRKCWKSGDPGRED